VGSVTGYAYDLAGQLLSVTDALGNATSYGYDLLGNISRVTDSNGGVTSYGYDAESNLVSVTSPTGVVEQWLYDPAGRLTETIRPGGAIKSYDYDALNRLVAIDYDNAPDAGVTWLYDAAGRRVAMSDPTGDSKYTYDALGRLLSVTQGDGSLIKYTHTKDGQLASITYPDESIVEYSYDVDGNLVTVTDASGVSRYTYNAAGDPTTLTRPTGVVTEYGYDTDQRVTTVTHTDAAGALISGYSYTYDAAGRISIESQTVLGVDATTQLIERAFTYDTAGRLTGYVETLTTQPTPTSPGPLGAGSSTVVPLAPPVVTPVPVPVVMSVEYVYDHVGNRIQVTRKDATGVIVERVDYTYDADNRLLKETSNITGVTTYVHDASGLLTSSSNYLGVMAYTYDADQRLAAVSAGGRLLMAASYDGDGERVFQVMAIPVSASIRVETGGVTDWLREHLPDTAGGVFWYGFITTLVEQVAGSNAALMVDMQPGVRTALTITQRSLESEQSLAARDIEALVAAGVTPDTVSDWIESAYVTLIPEGVTATVEGWSYELTHYVNDVNTTHTQVLATYGNAGTNFTTHTYGLDRLSTTSGGTDWYAHDGRGSVGQTLTSTGAIGFAATYDPWGQATITSGVTASPFYGFNGEEHAPVTGLQYLRARYYQPSTARFTQSDSYLGDPTDPATLHRYAYCVTDPINYVDPSGHAPIGVSVPQVSANLLLNKKKADGSTFKNTLQFSNIKRLVEAGATPEVILDAALATNSTWVEDQLTTLGWQVNRVTCVDTEYMVATGTSGWSNETIESLYPDGQIRTFTTIELVKLPPKYASIVDYDASLGLGETVGDRWFETASLERDGYWTLQEQQFSRQFFLGLAVSPAVVAGCTVGAAFCVAGAGLASNVTYVASTTSVGLQPDSMTAGVQTLSAMAIAAAPYAGKAAQSAFQKARAASNSVSSTTSNAASSAANVKPTGGYSNTTGTAPTNVVKPVATGSGSSTGVAPAVLARTPEELAEIASTIKHAPDVKGQRLDLQVIAVGAGRDGQLIAAANTSSYFTPKQRALLVELDIRQAISRTVQGTKLHAEENLLGSVSDIVAVGTSKLEPCMGICRPLLEELGIPWASKP
jgi:RHS repeat-associated protein